MFETPKMIIDPKKFAWHKAHHILTDIVTPRPIAFVSTISSDGINNLAPFSLFSPLCYVPMIVGFAVGRKKDGRKKDTLVNIENSKEYVINVVNESLSGAMVKSAKAYPPGIDEIEKTRLTPIKATAVNAPMVGESPINMECRLLDLLEFGDAPRYSNFVIGEMVTIHVKDEFFHGDHIDARELRIIGRLGGGSAYCRTTNIFNIRGCS